MPIYALGKELWFPPVEKAEPDGFLAVGGDLSLDRVLMAYQSGIFPWYSEDEPICWYAPNPRFVLFPDEFVLHKNLRKLANSGKYHIKMNTCFIDVLESCASIERPGQLGTWITDEMKDAYCTLHERGIAQSVEVFDREDNLCGGLYGLDLGRVFAGESMFSKSPDTSKLALHYVCASKKYEVIDCQVHTDHLERLGGRMIPLPEYLGFLQ